MGLKEEIHFRIDKKSYDFLKTLSKTEDVPISMIVRRLILDLAKSCNYEISGASIALKRDASLNSIKIHKRHSYFLKNALTYIYDTAQLDYAVIGYVDMKKISEFIRLQMAYYDTWSDFYKHMFKQDMLKIKALMDETALCTFVKSIEMVKKAKIHLLGKDKK